MGSRDTDIDPDQPVIGAGDKRRQRIARGRPKDRCVNDLHILPGQHIIRSQIARCGICEVSGVELRVTLVCLIRPALQCRLWSALAGWRYPAIDERMIEQLLDRTGGAITILRIGVLVARDDK
jgi:hypothetical protein